MKFQVQSTPLLCIRTSRCLSVAAKTSKCTNVISPPASSLVMSHELWRCIMCMHVTLYVEDRSCKNNVTAIAANDVEHFYQLMWMTTFGERLQYIAYICVVITVLMHETCSVNSWQSFHFLQLILTGQVLWLTHWNQGLFAAIIPVISLVFLRRAFG